MAESPEHQFLSDTFLSVISKFSASRLYSYRESSRKKFDFSCLVSKSWDYALDGQTLWRHPEGIDKDLRTLVVASEAQLVAYVARDTTKHRAAVYEAARDYKASGLGPALRRLKVFWVPSDFDADSEVARNVVHEHLKNEIVHDILFNIVFGKLHAGGVRATILASGMFGLELAVLHTIATNGFFNFASLRRSLPASANTLRDRILRLQMSGLILQPRNGRQEYYVGSAGRSLLRICAQLNNLTDVDRWLDDELIDILRLLELEPSRQARDNFRHTPDWLEGKTPEAMFSLLLAKAVAAGVQWSINWDNQQYLMHERELDQSFWLQV